MPAAPAGSVTTETIYFTKTFTKGLLKGLSYPDRITFPKSCRERYAKAYRVGTKRENYVIVDSSFINYQR